MKVLAPKTECFLLSLQLALRTPTASLGSLLNASRPHSELRVRSPLSEMTVSRKNAALVPASVRNRPPFTRVHSHAAAQNSSGAFFKGLDRERCRKRPGRARIALRASQKVRARDVMVNRTLI
ncbi:hypothetical protein DR190_29840 (plasmid) [Klebsiella pneumoniae]|nr:hypothetical protein DR190_29840 [Klebsiella pneumoniae]UUO86931.1 hypothetical protein DR189_29885 [Klebsiella pneumoniae]UUO92604.1 hypothetical protein DR188_29905 [Klebsiella pneumoniae]